MVPCCCEDDPVDDCDDICEEGTPPWLTISVSGWGGTCNQGFDNCCSLANSSFNVFLTNDIGGQCSDTAFFCAGFSRVDVRLYHDTGSSEWVLEADITAANQFAACSARAVYEKRWSDSSKLDCSALSSETLSYVSGSLVTSGTGPCTGGDSLTVTATAFGP